MRTTHIVAARLSEEPVPALGESTFHMITVVGLVVTGTIIWSTPPIQ